MWIFSSKLEKSNENDKITKELLSTVNQKIDDIYKDTSEIKDQCKKNDIVQSTKVSAMDGRIDTFDSRITTLNRNIYIMNTTVSHLVSEFEEIRNEKTEVIANFLRLKNDNKKSIEKK